MFGLQLTNGLYALVDHKAEEIIFYFTDNLQLQKVMIF